MTTFGSLAWSSGYFMLSAGLWQNDSSSRRRETEGISSYVHRNNLPISACSGAHGIRQKDRPRKWTVTRL
jgi:hypothetical protein